MRSVQFRIPESPEKDASCCYRAAHLDFGPGSDPPGSQRAHPFFSEHGVRAFQSGEEGHVLAFPFGKGVDRWGLFRSARQYYSYLV